MRNHPIPPESEPSPEQLAAFLDGELDPVGRARVTTWLKDNPAAAEEIEGQRSVVRLWQTNTPPEPDEVAWAATLARIAAKPPPRMRRLLPRTLLLGAGVAAAVLIVALLPRLFYPAAADRAANGAPLPLPVIGPDDVVVVSMDARDAAGLVVAAPPIREPILLASQEDVSVINVEPYWQDDGQAPAIGEGDVPMIVAPRVARAGGRTP